jgi:hypothetical protein
MVVSSWLSKDKQEKAAGSIITTIISLMYSLGWDSISVEPILFTKKEESDQLMI